MAMTAWGDKWLGDGTVQLTLRSKTTDQKLSIALVEEEGKPVRRSNVEIVIDAAAARDTRGAD
jgi:hypothetical protein